MFAVPGWAVPSSSLVQQQAARKDGESGSGGASKKRKRGGNQPDHDAAAEKLFSAHLKETKAPVKSQDAGEKRKKAKKHVEEEQNDSSPVTQSKIRTAKDTQIIPVGPEHRRERKKQRKLLESGQNEQTQDDVPRQQPKAITSLPPAPPPASKLTPLQIKMRSKLTSARFRHLNETLYTTTSSSALDLFNNSPELFAEYHAGFSQQVKDSWPQNPVETYVKTIRARGALSNPSQGVMPLPRRKTGSCTIADLGCGDAPLARGCQSAVKSLQLKFHNYDLYTPNNFVIKADISNLPLRDGEADIAIFCLSLMGTNWIAFVEESWRILRGDGKGEVWVAEVKSRFGRATKGRVVDNSVGKRRKIPKSNRDNNDDQYDGPEQFVEDARMTDQPDDETDISVFVKVFTRRGFQLREGSVNKNNKMFVSMVFTKSGIPTAGKHKGMKWTGKEYTKQEPAKPRFASAAKKEDDDINPEEEAKALKPCVYKVR